MSDLTPLNVCYIQGYASKPTGCLHSARAFTSTCTLLALKNTKTSTMQEEGRAAGGQGWTLALVGCPYPGGGLGVVVDEEGAAVGGDAHLPARGQEALGPLVLGLGGVVGGGLWGLGVGQGVLHRPAHRRVLHALWRANRTAALGAAKPTRAGFTANSCSLYMELLPQLNAGTDLLQLN